MQQSDISALENREASVTCRRISFDKAEVVGGFVSGTYILIVSGIKNWVTMDVELRPLIYIDKPEYWGIEVIGCQQGIGLPQTAPYVVALDISNVIGKKGIEVLGDGKSEEIAVP